MFRMCAPGSFYCNFSSFDLINPKKGTFQENIKILPKKAVFKNTFS